MLFYRWCLFTNGRQNYRLQNFYVAFNKTWISQHCLFTPFYLSKCDVTSRQSINRKQLCVTGMVSCGLLILFDLDWIIKPYFLYQYIAELSFSRHHNTITSVSARLGTCYQMCVALALVSIICTQAQPKVAGGTSLPFCVAASKKKKHNSTERVKRTDVTVGES